jgi:hypothetical protein
MRSYKMVTLTMPQDQALYEILQKQGSTKWHHAGLKYLDMKFLTDIDDIYTQWVINCKIINEKVFAFNCIKAGITPKITDVCNPDN